MTGRAPGGGAARLVRWLRRRFGRGRRAEARATVPARLEAIERQVADLARSIQALAPGDRTGHEPALAAIQEALAALDKQIGRAGREQFKANALAEAQIERLTAALEALRLADARREADLAAWREQGRAAQAAARLEVVRAVLPVLDGLDEALRAGQQVLARPAAPPRPPTWLERLGWAAAAPAPDDAAPRAALAAWLEGLSLVRQRLLDVLAGEGVRPMEAQARPFDPHQHVALEVVPATDAAPPGTVVAELRRGYLAGERVLRHAEVAVARDGAADGMVAAGAAPGMGASDERHYRD